MLYGFTYSFTCKLKPKLSFYTFTLFLHVFSPSFILLFFVVVVVHLVLYFSLSFFLHLSLSLSLSLYIYIYNNNNNNNNNNINPMFCFFLSFINYYAYPCFSSSPILLSFYSTSYIINLFHHHHYISYLFLHLINFVFPFPYIN